MAVIYCECVQMSGSDMQIVCKQSRPEPHGVTQYTQMHVIVMNNMRRYYLPNAEIIIYTGAFLICLMAKNAGVR